MRLMIIIGLMISLMIVTISVMVAASRAASFKLAPGWNLELVTQAPDILFPTAIVVADDGTIYLGQDPMDMPGPPTSPLDSVVAIKDGVVTPFAQNLWAVMGLEWIDDTLYVVHAPYLSAFRDLDGDGKADSRVDLVTGLGPQLPGFNGINDHVASGIKLGIDGFLYISVGDKGIPRATGIDGSSIQLSTGGVVRVRPDGSNLEIVSSGERNPLSVALNNHDDVFTYGNDDDSKQWPNSLTHHIVGGHYGYPYEFQNRPDRALPTLDGRVGGAGAQGLCYTEDGLAPRFQNNLFFCDWGLQAVIRYDIEQAAGTYRVREKEYIVRKGKVTDFRPFSLAADHAGNSLYLVDWAFNGFLAKGPKTGRLFRLTYSGADRSTPKPRPTTAELADPLRLLDHPALRVRLRAQRALAARGADSEPMLAANLKSRDHGVARLHALWALDAIGSAHARQAIRDALIDPDPEIQLQAIRSIGIRRDRAAVSSLLAFTRHPSPRLRRETAITLGRLRDPAALPALMAALVEKDPFTAWSIRQAIRSIGFNNENALSDLLLDPQRRDAALKLCDEWWCIPAARALAKAQIAADDPAFRVRLVFTLAGLYRKYPEWQGYWIGPNPLAAEFPRKTRDWEVAGMTAVFDGLAQALSDPITDVRRQAIIGLTTVGNPAAPLLRDRLEREPDPANLFLLLKAMPQLHDALAVPTLATILKDGKRLVNVRLSALEAISTFNDSASIQARLKLIQSHDVPESLRSKTIASLGPGQHIATQDLIGFLQIQTPSIRISALEACSSITSPSSEIRHAVIARLSDSSADVKLAAIRAVTALGLRETLPELMRLANDNIFHAPAITALARMPHPNALPLYLDALDDRDPDLRVAAESALLAIRDSVALELQSRANSNEFTSEAASAIERVLTRFTPLTDWQAIGPFPRNTPRLFLDPTSIDFNADLVGAGGQSIKWAKRSSRTTTGQVVINDLKSAATDRTGFGYGPTASPDLLAYAYAEIFSSRDRTAIMRLGSSGTITVSLNGNQVLHSANDAGRTFNADADRSEVPLKHGTNHILVRSRQGAGTWSFSVQLSDPSSSIRKTHLGRPSQAEMRDYATSHEGNAKRGEELFADARGIGCSKCHGVGKPGPARIGPDLAGLSLKYDKAEIIRCVLEPSNRIASGYQSLVVAKADGTVINGILKSEDNLYLDLIDDHLQPVRILKSDIEDRHLSDASFMPSGLVDSLTLVEFSDLITYLASPTR